ncbi:hypothetical protein ACHAP8_010442, partial [Fusarium lateritium]
MDLNLPTRPTASSEATSSQSTPQRVTFPIACLTGGESRLKERYECAKSIEACIQRYYEPQFRLRVEHFVTILLVPFKSLEPNGGLSYKTNTGHTLKDRLESVSPF